MIVIAPADRSRPVDSPCEICLCPFAADSLAPLRPDGLCYNCWHQHIRTALTQISYRVGSEVASPFEGRDPVDVCLALNALEPAHAADLEEWLFKKYAAFTPDIEKCPASECDYVFTGEGCGWERGARCPKCGVGLAADGAMDLRKLMGLLYFLFLTSRCPKCEIPIEKTTGCPHMTCPCGHEFCWYCLKDYQFSQRNVYSVHEPKECAFIFFSKISLAVLSVIGVLLTFLGNDVFQMCMGAFFLGARYLLHAMILDILLAINVIVALQLINRHRQYHQQQHYLSSSVLVVGLAVVDLVAGGVLVWVGLLWESGVILLVEIVILGVGAAAVWLIVFSIETWFDFIA